MRTKFKFLLILLTLLIGTACADVRIADDIALIQGIAYDMAEGDKIRGSFMIPIYENPESTKSDILTDEDRTSRGIQLELNEKSPNKLATGQLRVALFGQRVAERGILDIIDMLYRDTTIGNRIYLAVVKGKGEDLLKEEISITEHAAIYISNLIEQNIKNENLPSMNFHQFIYAYYSDGMDPFLPYLAKEKGNAHVKILGLALFDQDKMVSTLPRNKMFYFKLLSREGYQNGAVEIEMSNKVKDHDGKSGEFAAIENIHSNSRFFIRETEQGISVKINIKMDGIIQEFTGERGLQKPGVLNEIKRRLEKKIKANTLEMLKDFQKLNIDPIGIGEQYRSSTRSWNPKEWREKYPHVMFDINVDINILETGVAE